ncbi:hypothetical protein BB561_005939 [Smittium simulii]|uniref:Uncharacterized protein n=1 Tax=Smittium simulii TaxID=133385 RepID=A0A2T9Y7L2_9FUNG|nr:hypothetical protein BB561_005939 [Smittium simulii]
MQNGLSCECLDNGTKKCETEYEKCVRISGKGSPTFINQKGENCSCLQNGQTQCTANKSPKDKCLSDAGVKTNPFMQNGLSCECLDNGTKKCETEYEKCVRTSGKGSPTFTNNIGENCYCLQNGQTQCTANKSSKDKCLSDAGVKTNPFTQNGLSCECLDDGTKRCETGYEKCIRVSGRGSKTFTNSEGQFCFCLHSGETECRFNYDKNSPPSVISCLVENGENSLPFTRDGVLCDCNDYGIKSCMTPYETCVRVKGENNPRFKNDKGVDCRCLQSGEVECFDSLSPKEVCLKYAGAKSNPFEIKGVKCECLDTGLQKCETLYDICIRVDGQGLARFTNSRGKICDCLQNGQLNCISQVITSKDKCLSESGANANPFEQNGLRCECQNNGIKKCETEYEKCVRVDGKGNYKFKNTGNSNCECLKSGEIKCTLGEKTILAYCLEDAMATSNPFIFNGLKCTCSISGNKSCV